MDEGPDMLQSSPPPVGKGGAGDIADPALAGNRCVPADGHRNPRIWERQAIGSPAAMPVRTEAIGKEYPPAVYAIGREKVREYAAAVGETDPIHTDLEAARAAGFADVVAPPMFAVVYSAPVMAPAIF